MKKSYKSAVFVCEIVAEWLKTYFLHKTLEVLSWYFRKDLLFCLMGKRRTEALMDHGLSMPADNLILVKTQ